MNEEMENEIVEERLKAVKINIIEHIEKGMVVHTTWSYK